MSKTARTLLAIAASLIYFNRATAGVVSLRTVAVSNQLAPGATGDVRFSSFQKPILNRHGRVAFCATLSGTNVSTGNNSGYWFEDANGLGLIAREGAPAPGTPAGVLFSELTMENDTAINSSGCFAFWGQLTGSGINSNNNRGIWWTGPGALTLVARSGNPAPATGAGVNFSNNLGGVLLNDSNVLAFTGRMTGTGISALNDQGVWTNRTGPLTLSARSGSAIPGFPFGQTFGSIGATSLNNSNQMAFQGFVIGGSGLCHFVESNGKFRTIVADGWHIEPASFMLLYFPSTWPVLNDAGQVATFSGFNAPGSTSTSFYAVLSDTPGILTPVAKSLDVAPGTMGVAFSGFQTHTINARGRVAFKAILSDINQLTYYGVWSQGFGSLALVARGGDQAPGALNGVHFLEPSTPWLNGLGQVAFRSTLTGTGVDSTNDVGIYVQKAPGVLTEIAREGGSLEVAPGDVRTISTLSILTNENGIVNRQFAFNDFGHVVFQSVFTDGTQGVFVASVGTTFPDCNNDAAPDSGQLARNDCNVNQMPDDCDIALGTSSDCNGNGIPDSCEPMNADILWGGDFESGDFSGWMPSAGLVINNGDADPPGPSGKFVPYGRFGAMNTAAAPGGLFTVFQEVDIPASARSTSLTWTDEIRNYGAQFANPLQSFRVELRTPSNVVLATLYSTQPGHPLISAPTVRNVSIPPLPGKRVRIVFVIQCSQAHMNVHIDNVRLLCQTTSDCDNSGVLDPCQPQYSDINALVNVLTGDGPFNCLLDADQNGVTDGRDIEIFTRRMID